jgi:phosphate starvation-inducible PhoH-like protein
MQETTLKHAVAAAARPVSTEARRRADVSFPDMRNMPALLGQYDHNIILIENRLGVTIAARGANLRIDGAASAVDAAEHVLRDLYRQVEGCIEITDGIIDTCLRAVGDAATREIVSPTSNVVPQVSIRTKLKTIVPRTPAQASYMMALERDEMVFALGPAGTGKTYIAVAQAISKLMRGEVSKLILSRPAVEAGEKLGFLPGDLKEKVDPYLRPLYDAMHDCMPAEQVERRLASGEIEVAPLAFMRGRTLADAFIILDEAQNTTPAQMKMFLTRFGENSRMVICGDPNQTDLPGGTAASGLTDAVARLERVQGITMSRFGAGDVVRHPIVGRIVDAYEG